MWRVEKWGASWRERRTVYCGQLAPTLMKWNLFSLLECVTHTRAQRHRLLQFMQTQQELNWTRGLAVFLISHQVKNVNNSLPERIRRSNGQEFVAEAAVPAADRWRWLFLDVRSGACLSWTGPGVIIRQAYALIAVSSPSMRCQLLHHFLMLHMCISH